MDRIKKGISGENWVQREENENGGIMNEGIKNGRM